MDPVTDRLTKNELTWLLAQEARSAAQKLRRGVGIYSADESSLPPPTILEEGSGGVESTLNKLDEAVAMLANLHGHPAARGRRGKIDLAALLWEVAPEARVQIEMGEGTSVFGDESELRRMLHVLIGGSGDPRSGSSPGISIRRHGDEIRVGVNLGPDTPSTFEAERGWLARMATRYGGRLELDGSMQTLVLGADVDTHRRELETLKKELAAAQAQGEAYARELAAVFRGGDTLSGLNASLSGSPLPPRPSRMPSSTSDGLAVLVAAVRALSGDLRGILSAIGRDIAPLRDQAGEVGDIAGSVGRHITGASEVVADLARLGTCPIGELPRHTDIADLLREVVQNERTRAQRHGVELTFKSPDSAEDMIEVGAVTVLFHVLLDHAIGATPAGTTVAVEMTEGPATFTVTFDDGGAALPPSAQGSVLSRDFDAIALGRPQGLALIAASTIASHLRLTLELDEAPRGGTRVRLVLPRQSS
jgi:hypothetical protein